MAFSVANPAFEFSDGLGRARAEPALSQRTMVAALDNLNTGVMKHGLTLADLNAATIVEVVTSPLAKPIEAKVGATNVGSHMDSVQEELENHAHRSRAVV